MKVALVVALAAIACNGRSAPDTPPSHRTDDAQVVAPIASDAARPDAMTPSTPQLTWKTHPLADSGISVDLIDGAPISEGDSDGQRVWHQVADPVRLNVQIGSERTMAWFKQQISARNPSATFSQPEVAQVCGKKASRQIAQEPGRRGHDVATTRGRRWKKHPPITHVAVSLMHEGVAVLVTWTVETERRDEYAEAEQRFFDSIKCEAST